MPQNRVVLFSQQKTIIKQKQESIMPAGNPPRATANQKSLLRYIGFSVVVVVLSVVFTAGGVDLVVVEAVVVVVVGRVVVVVVVVVVVGGSPTDKRV